MLHSGLMSEKSNYILKKKLKCCSKRNEVRMFFFSSKSHWFQLLRKTVYPNYLYLLYLFPSFLSNESYVHYAVCYNRKVALNSILNYKKKTLLVVLCYNSIAQNYYRIWQGRRLIKRCRYTFSHQISMLPLPKNMKNDFSAALPPMQYNA